ncbi:MAG: 50S ribosomal protein L17 [Anaerolineae bacterium]|nr:50S ribosomal protein L17 [Anaerolineae bacterium]
MRHRLHGSRLGRDTSHRRALRQNLVADLICYEKVVTTEAKARVLRPLAEKMITLAKRGLVKKGENPAAEVHARRLAAARLPRLRTIEDEDGETQEINVVQHLFNEIAPRYVDRPGGYTRIIKLGQRNGDNANMAVVMLVGDDDRK